MKRSLKYISVLVSLLFASSCATTGGFNLVPPQEEIRLGQQLSQEIEREQPVLDNPVLQDYISDIGNRIASKTEKPDLPYTFKIIESDEVNAFALPGGPVYVNTGLLKYADNEAELASVLAHEIGHITARHATEQLTTSVGAQILTQILLGENPAAATALATNIATSLGMLKFSRNDELEADRLGVRYMFEAGYNPTAMVDFHRKLAAMRESNPSRVMSWFSTHPMSEDRVDTVAREIAKLPPGRPVQYYPERYTAILERELR
ncbi:MAG: peptidase M48 [Candidatus Abyssobacteria bacterium SURF_5]|uniref:Peptidase M48 n=1 Tax=Abyssobacteria bacterium (strain SURF_5) TaxID=2093360 RepID=A0A3A4NCS5_ABYX5|nr:MAG: peptidase M48 [Candidatus Abyssubacteria bacterium SURF_5]